MDPARIVPDRYCSEHAQQRGKAADLPNGVGGEHLFEDERFDAILAQACTSFTISWLAAPPLLQVRGRHDARYVGKPHRREVLFFVKT